MTTNPNTKPLLLTASSRLSAEEVLSGTLPGGVVVKRANAAGRRDQAMSEEHTRRVEASGSPSSSNGRPAPRETEAVGPGSVSVTVPIKNPAGALVPSPGSACRWEAHWKNTSPPADRAIWMRCNIVTSDGAFTEVEPFEGYALWDAKAEDWQNIRRLSIRCFGDAYLAAISWMELSERTAGCSAEETEVRANIYFWDDEDRRANNNAGWFAIMSVAHIETHERIRDESSGPFPMRDAALRALLALMESEVAK